MQDAIDSPLGKLIRPLIENMERMLKGRWRCVGACLVGACWG